MQFAYILVLRIIPIYLALMQGELFFQEMSKEQITQNGTVDCAQGAWPYTNVMNSLNKKTCFSDFSR